MGLAIGIQYRGGGQSSGTEPLPCRVSLWSLQINRLNDASVLGYQQLGTHGWSLTVTVQLHLDVTALSI